MKNGNAHKIILLILATVLCFAVVFGIAFGRYSGTWEHDFDLTILPALTSNVLADNVSGGLFEEETRHIVFGNAEDYADVIAALKSTEKHAGSSGMDKIWTYYDDETDTTYVLSDSIIYFNKNSSGLFRDLTLLESITFDNFSTDRVEDMSAMFANCPKLTQLNLVGFETAKVTDMSQMFSGCAKLERIYASQDLTTTRVEASSDMFTGCYVLTGGEGTMVYPDGTDATTQPLDKTYAWIDGLNGNPGYFTDESSLRKYFRSNELLGASQGASYTINGTTGWFTVANAMDSSTYSEAAVDYTLVWSVSTDGSSWTEYKRESASFAPNSYQVEKYELAPITHKGVTYNYVKVRAITDSFFQEDLEAVFAFVYNGYSAECSYSGGVITLVLHTNSQGGAYSINWVKGIDPDNSDPAGIFTDAVSGPSELTRSLNKNTVYEFLFFVTDETMYTRLENDPSQAASMVTVDKN